MYRHCDENWISDESCAAVDAYSIRNAPAKDEAHAVSCRGFRHVILFLPLLPWDGTVFPRSCLTKMDGEAVELLGWVAVPQTRFVCCVPLLGVGGSEVDITSYACTVTFVPFSLHYGRTSWKS